MKRFSVLLLSLLQVVMLVASQTTIPGMNLTQPQPKRIDTHCHLVPGFFKDLLESKNISAGGLPIPSWNVSAHLALNAQIGVVTSILSVSTPGAKLFEDDPVEEGRTLARQLNEYTYNVTLEYPKRFLFFATLTLPDVEGAVAEAVYALDTLKAAGVVVMASAFGELFGTPRYAPLYKVLNDRNATVFIHPSNSPCPEETEFAANSTDLPPYVIDFLLDTTRAATNLVYRNVTTDYPNITFILAHSGGFLPFAATRASGGLSVLSGDSSSQSGYFDELKKFMVDVAISATSTSLPSTTAFFGTTHLTYGSDFPYAPELGVFQNTNGLNEFNFDNGVKKQINFLNAYRVFKNCLA